MYSKSIFWVIVVRICWCIFDVFLGWLSKPGLESHPVFVDVFVDVLFDVFVDVFFDVFVDVFVDVFWCILMYLLMYLLRIR